MSGTPSEAEIQAQWRNSVALLEGVRSHADGTVAGAGGQLDTLGQSLEGEYTPTGLAGASSRFRAGLSALIQPSMAQEFLLPCLYEYARLMGSPYSNGQDIMAKMRERFDENGLSVESRAITYDTSATAGAGNVGNGVVARLTVDEFGYNLEACTVEKKTFRCRADMNSGAKEFAEEFEVSGAAASFDSVLRYASGSGATKRITASHAGSSNGGSLLQNSSFSSYNSTATPKFVGWTQVAGGASLTQDTTNFYRSHPGATVDGSLKITGGSGTVTVSQSLEDMRQKNLSTAVPYFLRIMVNKTVGTASGGSVTLRMGSQSVTTAIASLGSGWVEMVVGTGIDAWFREFNEADFAIEIEWTSSTSGYLLVDDVIFTPWTLIDGTYWMVRHNVASPVSWLVNDTLEFTDTGGAPATGKIQYWLWVAGLGCLPSTTGTPTFTEP